MGRLAILGASSQIAKDLILSLAAAGDRELLLFVRDADTMRHWLRANSLDISVHDYSEYGHQSHDAVINFVGVGDPRRAAELGAGIFRLTQDFDDLVLEALKKHPDRRYIFLSSGAVYGSRFDQPADRSTMAVLPINALARQDYYGAAKLHAECTHRAFDDLPITDLRVFNYFSRTQAIDARFFVTDMLRAILDQAVLRCSAAPMMRDYLHPSDFCQLIKCILAAPAANGPIDCYSLAPVSKVDLLSAMQTRFGLRYEFADAFSAKIENATGAKSNYYSLNRQAAAIGYLPGFNSLDAVITESAELLERHAARRLPTSQNESAP